MNPNMPLRFLPYVTDVLYTWLKDKRSLHKNKLVTIPTPKFHVLYNGKNPIKDSVLRLSDAFRFSNHDFSMELTVNVINVNYKSGSKVLQKSPSLHGYAYLINQINRNISGGTPRDKAITAAVNHCMNEKILADFLEEHYKEVCDMFDWGITLEEEIEIRIEEAVEERILKSALKLLQKGMDFKDVISMLELSGEQIGELEKRFA